MINLRKSRDRLHTVNGGQETWQSFSDETSAHAAPGFRSLESFREESLAPGAAFQFQAARDLETVSYTHLRAHETL